MTTQQSKTKGKKKQSSKASVSSIGENVKKLKQENEKLRQELKEKNEKLLRSLADLQNYQKRMEKELRQREEETKNRYLNELLDLYEMLRKAYDDENPKEGLKLLLQNLDNLFKNENITYIDCVGKPFDHAVHHAITTVERNDCEDNIIVDEIKKGYFIGDKLLRPSQVVVAKKIADQK